MSADLKARIVAGTAIFRGEQILLLRRSLHRTNPGIWDLPGGHVEARETIPRAARRETREETGFQVRLGPVFYAEAFNSASKRGRARPTVGIYYHCVPPVRKSPRLDGEEHTQYAWVASDDLRSYPTIPFLERTIRAAFRTRSAITALPRSIDYARLDSSERSELSVPS
jgi:8-oxo-dGTP diphosphatase